MLSCCKKELVILYDSREIPNSSTIQNIEIRLCKDSVFGMAFGLVFMIESHKVEATSLEMTFFTTTIILFFLVLEIPLKFIYSETDTS